MIGATAMTAAADASAPTAASVAAGVTAMVVATATAAVVGGRGARKRKHRQEAARNNGRHQSAADAPAVFPPPQDLPLLRRQRPEDRLQGRAPPAALHLRAWQDRAVAH